MPPVSNGNTPGEPRDQVMRGFPSAAKEVTTGESPDVDPALAALLDGIAQEVQAQAGLERAGIMGSYAAKVAHARTTLRGPQLAAMLQSLKQERQAALKALQHRIAIELKGRMAAARRRFFRAWQPPKPR